MALEHGIAPTLPSGQVHHENQYLYYQSGQLDLDRVENPHIQGIVKNNSELCDKQSGRTMSWIALSCD